MKLPLKKLKNNTSNLFLTSCLAVSLLSAPQKLEAQFGKGAKFNRGNYGMKGYSFSLGIDAHTFNYPEMSQKYGTSLNLTGISFSKGLSRLGDLETNISYDAKNGEQPSSPNHKANLDYLRFSVALKDFVFSDQRPDKRRFHFGTGFHYTKMWEELLSNEKIAGIYKSEIVEKNNSSTGGLFYFIEYDLLKYSTSRRSARFSLRFSQFFSNKDSKTDMKSDGLSLGFKIKLYNPF